MMNPKTTLLLASGAILVGLSFAASGCTREPEAPPVVQYTPPPPAESEAPPVTPIHELMQQLRIDDRIVMYEDQAPDTDEARKAVLEFFDAFARGDSRALSSRLMEADRRELQAMVDSGVWEQTTRNITRIEVQTGMSPHGDCALAVFEVARDYQVQLWYYAPSVDDPERFEFDAAATPPNMMSKLSGTDWIKAWHDILEEERELAFRLDTPVNVQQRNLDESKDQDDGGTPAGPSGPLGPAAPPSGPDDDPAPPRRPPGIPGPR